MKVEMLQRYRHDVGPTSTVYSAGGVYDLDGETAYTMID